MVVTLCECSTHPSPHHRLENKVLLASLIINARKRKFQRLQNVSITSARIRFDIVRLASIVGFIETLPFTGTACETIPSKRITPAQSVRLIG